MSPLRHLLPAFRRHRRAMTAGLLCVLGMSLIGLLSPLVVGRAVDALATEVRSETLLFYAALVVGIALVQGVFSFGQRRILVAVSREIENELRNDYFAHLERLPQSFYHRSYTGDLMARATNDLEAVRQVCGPAVMYGANTLFAGIGSIVFMVGIHAWLTATVLLTLPMVAMATNHFGNRIHTHFQRVQEEFSRLSTRVQESFAGARVVRAYAQEKAEEESFRKLNRVYVEENRKLILWSAAFHPVLTLLIGTGFAAVLGYGGYLTYRGVMTIGQLVEFNLFLGKLTWPMIAVGWVSNLVQRGSASMGRLREVLETVPEIADPAAGSEEPLAELETLRGDLAFRGLDFTYAAAPGKAGPQVLSGIDFEVPAGTTVALVGRTGAGKSTLLSLIPRLVDPPPGRLFVDGVDVLRLPLRTLRSSIAMVPQETFLFSATVRDNIAFGRPEASLDEVREAALAAGLDRDLELLPQGLDTVVGERGVTLSGGQKQRVALARALLRQPAILLLDDCLSAVDTETEERILANLRRIFGRATVLLVSHRISTVRHADLILVLEDGRVSRKGSHDELLALPGLYAELALRQQLEEQLAAVS